MIYRSNVYPLDDGSNVLCLLYCKPLQHGPDSKWNNFGGGGSQTQYSVNNIQSIFLSKSEPV